MGIRFIKMHGLGNDFVVLDARDQTINPTADFLCAVADRKRGIGCDQIIILRAPLNKAAYLLMEMYNADGSTVRACGNATRCVARLMFDETGRSSGVLETVAGLLVVERLQDGNITVDFGVPRLDWHELPTAQACDTLHLPLAAGGVSAPCGVSMGNPHAVFFVDDIAAVDVEKLGALFERDPLFPDRCNIEFAQILSPDTIRMRVWERGTGVTEACGTGASATLVAAVRRGLSGRSATIILDGGEVQVTWRQADDHVILAGGAALVARGEIEGDMISQARPTARRST